MKMKKCLAIILALVMALGCMSFTAFADGEEELFDETIDFIQQDVSGAIYETREDDEMMTVKIAAITEISTEHFTIDFSNAFCRKRENKNPNSGEVIHVEKEPLLMASASNITISSTNGKQTITKVEIISDGFYRSVDTGNGPFFTPEDENVTSDCADGNLIFSNINSDEISMTSCSDMETEIQKIRVYYTQSSDPSGTTCPACNGTGKNPGVTAAEAALDAAQSASEAITVINNPMDNSSFVTACENLLIAGDAASDAALAVEAAIAYDISGHLSTILEKLPSIGTKAEEYLYYSSQGGFDSTIQASTALIGLTAAAEAIIDAASGYLDEAEENCPVCGGTGMIEGSSFLTTFTLNKDYNDKYTADTKSTAVNETVSFTITPISTGDDVPEFTSSTFTIDVTDGVGEAEVDLPDTDDITSVGEYWYTITETAGTTAGVTYDNTTYYLHLIVSYKDGEFGFSSAAIRSSNEVTADENGEYPTTGKIDTVSNSYGEGTLTVAQTTTVNDEASDEDAFGVTVTFTAPAGTTVIGDITYGDDQTVTFNENGVGTAVINLKGGESVTFENIPDGVTYTVEQTGKNEDKGYTLDEVAFDVTDETGDSVTNNIASGTIGDAADTVTISNSKTVPIDVGVILENGAFIVLALGALIAAAWLIVSKRRKSVDAE